MRNNTTITNGSSTELSCQRQGLGTSLLTLQVTMAYLVVSLSIGMGTSTFGELLTFTKVAAGVRRLFLGLVLSTPPIFFLGFVAMHHPDTFPMSDDQMLIASTVCVYIFIGPFILETFLNDIVLAGVLNIVWFQANESSDKLEGWGLMMSRWNCQPGRPFGVKTWPYSWRRFISSGDWATIIWDNSGRHLKAFMVLDDYSVPVHSNEVEKDKIIHTTDEMSVWEIGARLNDGRLSWEHDYFYVFNPQIQLWFKIHKLSNLKPDTSTSSGSLLDLRFRYNSLQTEYHQLRKEFDTFKANLEEGEDSIDTTAISIKLD
eukprot:g4313.t1